MAQCNACKGSGEVYIKDAQGNPRIIPCEMCNTFREQFDKRTEELDRIVKRISETEPKPERPKRYDE